MAQVEDCIAASLVLIENFIEQTTGKGPTPEEMANALKRYFVLNEIKEHVLLERSGSQDG